MKVSFTGRYVSVDAHGINIQFDVDGSLLNCYVSIEALQKIDTAPQKLLAIQLFERNTNAIVDLAESKIRGVLPIRILEADVP